MCAPRIHSPNWGASAPTARLDDVRVSREEWLGAARHTEAELWELAQLNRTSAPASVPLMADAEPPTPTAPRATISAEGPPRPARLAPTPPLDAESDGVMLRRSPPRASPPRTATPHALRSRRRFVSCPNCSEQFTPPKAKKKATRYLPPEPRFVSWIEARGGSASLSAISRRFNLTRAERDVLLGRFTGARDGIILPNLDGRGGGLRFTLLRRPRRPQTLPPL